MCIDMVFVETFRLDATTTRGILFIITVGIIIIKGIIENVEQGGSDLDYIVYCLFF